MMMMMGNREDNGVLVDAKPHLEFRKIERKIMTVVVDISLTLSLSSLHLQRQMQPSS
jgi:hypothetical protein